MRRYLAGALPLVLASCGGSPAFAAPRIAAPGQAFPATVVRVTDGDTISVDVPAWSASPFGIAKVRISGIDTPETRQPPARCKAEIALGKAASAYAKTVMAPGDAVTLTYRGLDKYARVDGAITLPDGRDFATLMLGSGLARPYGGGTKSSWCRKPAPQPPARPNL